MLRETGLFSERKLELPVFKGEKKFSVEKIEENIERG